MKKIFVCALAVTGLSAVSSAASLDLDYILTPEGGGVYQYQFTLGVNTSVTGWAAGMGWDWLIFGDEPSGTSPLADFTMTSSFPVGPWTSLSSTGGGHNGPNFNPPTGAYWVPTNSSQTLSWTGTSHFDGTQGTILFSELITEGGATGDNFAVATLVSTPEPASFLALGGVAVLFLRKRRVAK